MPYPNRNGNFQEDNAPYHGPSIVEECFQDHEEDIVLLRWSQQSDPLTHLN